ncbi:hypothetical protein MASR2M15_10030 [Anaerolineales bacterium]
MNRLSQDLLTIATLIQSLQESDSFNAQQTLFINHIQKTVHQLQNQIHAMPDDEFALQQLIPILGEDFLKTQLPIFGYAKMLLEMPEQFAGAEINDPHQRQTLQSIFDTGQKLYQESLALQEQAQANRARWHNDPPQVFDLSQLVRRYMDLYRFWLHDRPSIKLINALPDALPFVFASQYHVSELIRHIIVLMGHDFIEYGWIELSAFPHPQSRELHTRIFCTGIQMDESEYNRLFRKDNRYLYLQRLESMGGRLWTEREEGRGAAVLFSLPLSDKNRV